MGALIMRLTMIFIGAALINRFHWIIYIFGGFLVYTGIRMFTQKETELEPEENPLVRLVTRFIPVVRRYDEEKFFTRVNGKLTGTLLLLVLVVVEFTDLVFAVDSIPAIFAITTKHLHRLHFKRLCNSRSALDVFSVGGSSREVSLP